MLRSPNTPDCTVTRRCAGDSAMTSRRVTGLGTVAVWRVRNGGNEGIRYFRPVAGRMRCGFDCDAQESDDYRNLSQCCVRRSRCLEELLPHESTLARKLRVGIAYNAIKQEAVTFVEPAGADIHVLRLHVHSPHSSRAECSFGCSQEASSNTSVASFGFHSQVPYQHGHRLPMPRPSYPAMTPSERIAYHRTQ